MSEDTRDTATCGDSLLPKPNLTELQDVTAGLNDVDEKKALASPDAKVEVKFVSADSQNGDAILDIENVRAAFSGMGKEELMKFANDPFWVRTRWVLFVGFWLLWAAMVAGAIAIIVLAPKCAPPKPRRWWEQSSLYSIDSLSSDGTNDLTKIEGIERYLERLRKVGADGVILPSVLNTGSSNHPEAVVEFKAIKADIGSLDDFKRTLKNAKQNGGHVILDISPGHTSKEHEWFKKSSENDDRYKAYYIWVNSTLKDNNPPSQWGEDWSQGAFVWNDKRGAFYLRQGADDLPVLNLTNPAVMADIQDVLRFWLDSGVSGFQIRHASNLFADDRLNLPKSTLLSRNQTSAGTLVVQNLHSTVTNHTHDNVLILNGNVQSAYQDNKVTGLGDVLSTPISLLTLQEGFTASQLRDKVLVPINESASKWPLWDISESQVKSSLIPQSLLDGLLMTTMVLPGTPVIHHGSLLDLSALSSGSATNGAVSTGSNDKTASQKRADIFKELASVRKSMDAFNFGVTNVTLVNGSEGVSVFTLTRIKAGSPGILVVLNPSSTNTSVNLSALDKVPEELTIHSLSLASSGDNQLQPKSKLPSSEIKLPEKSAIIFTFVPKKDG